MSKGLLTKLSGATFILILVFSIHLYKQQQSSIAKYTKACLAVNSNLPMNHTNHPCRSHQLSNQSWWSWFAGNSPSAHFHFLDLVELLHRLTDSQAK